MKVKDIRKTNEQIFRIYRGKLNERDKIEEDLAKTLDVWRESERELRSSPNSSRSWPLQEGSRLSHRARSEIIREDPHRRGEFPPKFSRQNSPARIFSEVLTLIIGREGPGESQEEGPFCGDGPVRGEDPVREDHRRRQDQRPSPRCSQDLQGSGRSSLEIYRLHRGHSDDTDRSLVILRSPYKPNMIFSPFYFLFFLIFTIFLIFSFVLHMKIILDSIIYYSWDSAEPWESSLTGVLDFGKLQKIRKYPYFSLKIYSKYLLDCSSKKAGKKYFHTVVVVIVDWFKKCTDFSPGLSDERVQRGFRCKKRLRRPFFEVSLCQFFCGLSHRCEYSFFDLDQLSNYNEYSPAKTIWYVQ